MLKRFSARSWSAAALFLILAACRKPPAKVVVPASTTKAVSGPLAAAANAGDPNAIDAAGTEGSDGTTGAPTDSNASDDPEGQFGPADSAGTVQDPTP